MTPLRYHSSNLLLIALEAIRLLIINLFQSQYSLKSSLNKSVPKDLNVLP